MLYGLLGIMAFLITGGNHSYPEIITAIRVGSYFFEAYICHLYAGLIQNFEVEFENFEETKVSNLESTCEPGKEQDSGAETEIQIEMGEIQVKVDSVKEIDEVMES